MTAQTSKSANLSSESDAQSGTGGGNLAHDIGSRDEERTATGGDSRADAGDEAGQGAARYRNHVRQ
ncbi:hypothetical protein BV98_002729 [Sphingobium herbicidovorans NBRC 16415]|uniref:Uncharacterized protein n=1 Tax=Sphingobium herbicidovorans (strain ATCC 700291 / DSM 11019 / CCUG 56400 / KCTC 2939 / LMG 18315 / NBRC 16415 / MH) TaxID=1219045 RepID=A0A086P7U7_SPHHM|nr:hypothetical protein BV98_002729 [Sphingobium herbicidovorans NBRC 16415]